MKRECSYCKELFEESELDESHDIPCYLFSGENRKDKKQKSDKEGRHFLCKEDHLIYEKKILNSCLNYLGEEETISSWKDIRSWSLKISKLDKELKNKLLDVARNVKKEVWENGK